MPLTVALNMKGTLIFAAAILLSLLPVILRYDGTPSTLALPVWEPVKPGTTATLRLVLFNHVEGDEVVAQLNNVALKGHLVDPQWNDARIFSPLPQPETVPPGSVVRNVDAQKLTRIEFRAAVESLQRGPNALAISVNRTGPFPASRPVKVEKVELHLKGSRSRKETRTRAGRNASCSASWKICR